MYLEFQFTNLTKNKRKMLKYMCRIPIDRVVYFELKLEM